MRPILVTAIVTLGFGIVSTAQAQSFGQYLGAEPLPVNGRLFGAYVHSSEHLAGLLSQLRLSFYPGMDFGFRGGFARRTTGGGSDRTTLRLGADIKVALPKQSETSPVAIAIGADLGVETGDNFHVLTFGPNVVASRTFASGQGGAGVSPYLGAGLAFASFDFGGAHDSEFSVPLRAGADFRINSQLGLVLEMQVQMGGSLNNHFGLAGGVNLPF